jgi:uncharacterized membrane protein
MRKISAKHRQWLEKELPILESEGIISRDTHQGISTYYTDHTTSGLHWAVIAFAVLGSLLIGAGIILLFAHNWDELTRPTRAVLSFCPLIIGSVLSIAAMVKNGGTALRESAGLFHSLSVGAAIALIGQTYNLPSDVPAFMLTWSLLILPLIFLLRSTGVLLVYLGLIWGWTINAQETYGQAAAFWALFAPAALFTVQGIRGDADHPATLIRVWGALLALIMSVGFVLERTVPGLWIIAYSALLSGAGLLGVRLYAGRQGWSNPLKAVGLIGIAVLAYVLTFMDCWDNIGWNHIRTGWNYTAWGVWLDSAVTVGLLGAWVTAAVKAFRRDSLETVTLAAFPVIGLVTFLIGSLADNTNAVNAVFYNAFMLYLGVMYVVMGCRNTRLKQLNGGMAILSLLLVTRFFDVEMEFLARGIVFIVLGCCFLSANLVMARRKKIQEVSS